MLLELVVSLFVDAGHHRPAEVHGNPVRFPVLDGIDDSLSPRCGHGSLL